LLTVELQSFLERALEAGMRQRTNPLSREGAGRAVRAMTWRQ
jgi:hypothetical protein